MKKNSFWIWYIPFIIIICAVVYFKLSDLNKNAAPLLLDNLSEEYYELYESDDYKIYTKYRTDYYKNEPLVSLFKENKITIEEITDKMELKYHLKDGGTKVYYSNDKKLSNKEFYITRCNTLNDNKDIFISDKEEECK